MRIITRKLPVNHNLFLFGDDHEGTILRHDEGWEQLCNMMESEYDGCKSNYGIHHGDPIEAIMTDDPRYDMDTVKEPIPLKQVEAAKKNLNPIKRKVIAMCEGNHPLKLHRFGALTRAICEPLGVEYGTWSFKLVARDARGSLMYKSFHTHGRKSITSTADDVQRRKTNRELILKRHLKFKMGDVALAAKGHSHQLIVCEPQSELYMTDDGDVVRKAYTAQEIDHTAPYIHPDSRFFVNTGSFLRLYGDGVSGYAEIGEYDPIEIGFAVAKIRDRKIVGVDKVRL